jgi:tetratricopeptide (TPR) repeat protein
LRGWIFTVLLWLVCFVAFAEPKAEASTKKKDGDKLFAEGDIAGALMLYEEAVVLFPDPELDLARASALLKLRRYEESKAAYESYLQSKQSKQRQAEVKKAIAELDKIMATSLSCTSTPSGATVYLNSKLDGAVGVTPFETHLSPGTYRVIFEEQGFVTKAELIDVIEGTTTQANTTLTENRMTLQISSEPPGAIVKLGGIDKGKTPLSIEVPTVAYDATIELPQYKPHAVHLEPKSNGETLSYSATLEAIPAGTVTIKTKYKADISLGEQRLNANEASSAISGVYQLQVTAKNYSTYKTQLEVKAEQATTIDLTLREAPKASTKLLFLASGGAAALSMIAASTALGFQHEFKNTGDFGCYFSNGSFLENQTECRRTQVLGRASTGLFVLGLGSAFGLLYSAQNRHRREGPSMATISTKNINEGGQP